jgi:hypothetical protein
MMRRGTRFASNHYALHQNENLLKAQMGHSKDEDTLMQHYRSMRTRAKRRSFGRRCRAERRYDCEANVNNFRLCFLAVKMFD